jgi:plasmid maintenance system killer protein
MRTGKHGFSRLTRWGRSDVSFLTWRAAEKPQALNLPGYRFHQLKGEYRGFYSVTVTGNDRIIFRFVDGNAVDVDYLDYH